MSTIIPGSDRDARVKLNEITLAPTYDITPDGERFVFVQTTAVADTGDTDAPVPQINIVLNWFEELKERVPVP